MMDYSCDSLPGGARVVTERIDHVRSVALGIWIACGSRDEKPGINGISHLIEHMLFKGTTTRSPKQIALSLEALGGSLDGFTSKELTCYHARFLDEHLDVACDVLLDLLGNPLFDENALEMEKGVISEEIKSYYDTPEDVVFNLFFRALFPNHPLSLNVLGTQQDVRAINKKQMVDYMTGSYAQDGTVIAAAGNIDHNELMDYLKSGLTFTASRERTHTSPNDLEPFIIEERPRISQAHIAMGSRIFPYNDKRRYPLLVLNQIAGSGMSSRLFQRLREKEGLVYTVSSFAELFFDTGLFGVYLAVDPRNAQRAVDSVKDEIEKLRHEIPENELVDAKSSLKGSIVIGLESTTSRMMRLARGELYLNEYVSLDETLAEIEKVDVGSIQEILSGLFVEGNLSTAVVSPTPLSFQ
jgi:predicted Zn-dependent peptidase